jgi:hypothetical protein
MRKIELVKREKQPSIKTEVLEQQPSIKIQVHEQPSIKMEVHSTQPAPKLTTARRNCKQSNKRRSDQPEV